MAVLHIFCFYVHIFTHLFAQAANFTYGVSYVFTISLMDLLTIVNKERPIISGLIAKFVRLCVAQV